MTANGESVLLIEDDADVRDVVSQMLIDLGYAVTACDSGEEAMTQLNSGRACDVIVTDVMMPGTSGLELSTLVRRWRPRTPVILITGKPDGVERAVDEGLIPLLKPFSREQLRGVMTEALRASGNSR